MIFTPTNAPCTGTGTADWSQANENMPPPTATAIPGRMVEVYEFAALFGAVHMFPVFLYPVTHVQLSTLVAPATVIAECGGQLSGSEMEKGA